VRALFRFILGLFGLLGRALDLLGRSLLYLILLLVIGFVVSLLLQPAPEVPRGAALVLRPSGALVEQTVFVVRWRSTQRAKAREAVRRLNLDGASPAGVVLNMIDPSAYGEYDAGYGYQAVKRYYGE